MMASRGDIFYAQLNFLDGVNNEGLTPVLILENQSGSRYMPTIICAVITKMKEPKLPVHISIEDENCPLVTEATIRLEIIHTIDKKRLREKLRRLNDEMMDEVDAALKIIFGLNDPSET